MDTTLKAILVLGGVVVGLGLIVAFAFVFVSRLHSKTQHKTKATEESKQSNATSKSPDTYTVRSVRRHIAMRHMLPRLAMWAVVVTTVTIALYFYDPTAFTVTIRLFGPSIGTVLLGGAVLGIGFRMEEDHKSYEYSRLGWTGALVLWTIAVAMLYKELWP